MIADDFVDTGIQATGPVSKPASAALARAQSTVTVEEISPSDPRPSSSSCQVKEPRALVPPPGDSFFSAASLTR